MAKRDFYPTGATCWQGGSCTRRGSHVVIVMSLVGMDENSNRAPTLTTGTHSATRLTPLEIHTGIELLVRRPEFLLSSA